MKRVLGRLVAALSLRPSSGAMEITRANFKERLPDMEAAIDSAAFLAIDGEFTGLSADKGNSPFDLPHERYTKVQESARQFLLVQFGVCTFHYDPDQDTFSHQAFNVYVWPRPCSRSAPDRRFLCQTTSIDFLSNQKFDFNKLFRDGVSYLPPAEMEKMRDSLRERQETRRLSQVDHASNLPIRIPEDQEEFVAGVVASIQAFLASDEQSLELEKCNSFQRRLIYQTAKEKFPDSCSLSSITKTGGDRVLVVVKADTEQQEHLANLKDRAELTDLEEALGFTKVIQKITESGKLVIGHNMLLDIAYTLNQFCGPLPADYPDFKLMCSSALPNLLDTKLMANTPPFRQEIFNSSLEELHKTVSLPPYSLPATPPQVAGRGYSLEGGEERFHEAGYDALITGRCFLALAGRLGHHSGQKTRVLPGSSLLQPFVNKLFLMRIQDIPYMDLSGDDLVPDRAHVFHLRFPKEWKTGDIIHIFQEAGLGHVFVSWLDDTSAYVAIKEKETANQVLSVLSGSTVFSISSYSSHVAREREEAPRQLLHCGVTPTFEKAGVFGTMGCGDVKKSEKRGLALPQSEVKRHKSVGEEGGGRSKAGEEGGGKNKVFTEPEWE